MKRKKKRSLGYYFSSVARLEGCEKRPRKIVPYLSTLAAKEIENREERNEKK